MPRKDPCQKQACAIQKCLQANNYVESRCEDVIRAMRKCCEVHAGKDSVCCTGFTRKTTDNKTQRTARDVLPNNHIRVPVNILGSPC